MQAISFVSWHVVGSAADRVSVVTAACRAVESDIELEDDGFLLGSYVDFASMRSSRSDGVLSAAALKRATKAIDDVISMSVLSPSRSLRCALRLQSGYDRLAETTLSAGSTDSLSAVTAVAVDGFFERCLVLCRGSAPGWGSGFYDVTFDPYARVNNIQVVDTPPGKLYGYNWIQYLAPDAVDLLGGWDRVRTDAPVEIVEPIEAGDGRTGALTLLTKRPAEISDGQWSQWRRYLEPVLMPRGPANYWALNHETWGQAVTPLPLVRDDWAEDWTSPEYRAELLRDVEQRRAQRQQRRGRHAQIDPAAAAAMRAVTGAEPSKFVPAISGRDRPSAFAVVDRPGHVLAALRERLPEGLFAVVAEGNAGRGVLVGRGTRPGDVLLLVGTAAPGRALDSEALAAVVNRWHATYGFVIDEATPDAFKGRLLSVPPDADAFAREIVEIGSLGDFGDEDVVVRDIAKALRRGELAIGSWSD